MQRLRFVGPEGSPWPGRVLRAVAPTQTKLSVLQRLQEETGLKVPEIIERSEEAVKAGDVLWPMGVTVFLAVNNAGFTMSLAEVLDTFSMTDVESISDDAAPADPSDAPGPTSAPTASGQGDVEGVAPAPVSRAKPKKTSTKR